jgi:hypothetical protein
VERSTLELTQDGRDLAATSGLKFADAHVPEQLSAFGFGLKESEKWLEKSAYAPDDRFTCAACFGKQAA